MPGRRTFIRKTSDASFGARILGSALQPIRSDKKKPNGLTDRPPHPHRITKTRWLDSQPTNLPTNQHQPRKQATKLPTNHPTKLPTNHPTNLPTNHKT